jgi:dTDP-glucose 4,6-dehydratase
VSKQAAEKYILYMYDAYKFPGTVLRPFNTYGRRDNTHFLVERILVQMLRGDTVKLGDPTPERDLIYVEDHVDAYLSCLNHPKALGQTFNFGSGEKITVRAVAEKLAALTGHKGQILWNTIPKRPLDIQILYGDSTKAKNVLGWTPKVSLDEGLRLTMEFWKKKLAGADSGRARTATS